MSAAGQVEQQSQGDLYVSFPDTCRELNKSRYEVTTLVVHKELLTEKVAGRAVITRASLDAYKARTGVGNEPEAGAR